LDDFKRRVSLTKDEFRTLAELGALNCFAGDRRSAMWKVEETLHDDLLKCVLKGSAGMLPAVRSILLRTRQRGDEDNAHEFPFRAAEETSGNMPDEASRMLALPGITKKSPLTPMTLPERVRADYETMNLTAGPHPMKLLRKNLPNIWRAADLVHAQHGSIIQIAGNVICRQRPGTAKGFVFISLEDETGVSNAIVDPDLFERFRLVITEEAFLLIEGQVQNSDGVVLIKAREIRPLVHERLVGSESHDFH
jgi:error-prone DNA polymerase